MFVILRSLTAKSHDIEFSAFVIWRMSSAIISKRTEFVIIKFVLYGKKNAGLLWMANPAFLLLFRNTKDYLASLVVSLKASL